MLNLFSVKTRQNDAGAFDHARFRRSALAQRD
jgi:hypothetical protein